MRKEIKQRLFNKVTKHLLTQNKKALNPMNKACLYRGPDNTKCAIGCLIPDSLYDINMEADSGSGAGGTFIKILKYFPNLESHFNKLCRVSKLSKEDQVFFIKLQTIHDSYNISLWKDKLQDFANKQGLKFNE